MKRLFLLLALAMPFFLYGEELSILTSILSTDALVFDDTVATTDSAGGTDLIVRPDTPEDLTVPADTLPKEVLEALKLHLQDHHSTASLARRAGGTVTLLDSSITVDQNGTPTKKMVYDYDERNRNYKTTTYFYTNGVPNGTSQVQEKVFDGTSSSSTILNTKYQWDATSSQWKGQSRTETVYDDTHHTISNVTYSWNPSSTYWTPTASTTYLYDALFRVPEQWTWTIDNSTKKLKPSTRTQQEWDSKGQLILKEIFTGGINSYGDWEYATGSSKSIYQYTDFGTTHKQTLKEEYPSYDTSKKQLKGQNGRKVETEYTANGTKVTRTKTYNWDNTSFAYYLASDKTNTFNSDGRDSLIMTYNYNVSGAITGCSGTRTIWTGSHADSVFTYAWNNTTKVAYISKIVVSIVNDMGKTTVSETWNYNSSTGLWSGTGKYWGYAVNGTSQTYYSTATLASSHWTPGDSTVYLYSGSTQIGSIKYKWSTATNQWVLQSGGTQTISTTGVDGSSISITYTCDKDSNWTITNSTKTLPFTDSQGGTGTITYTLSSDTWVIKSGSKTRNFIDDNGATISLTWIITNPTDSIWSPNSGTKAPVNIKDVNGHDSIVANYYFYTDATHTDSLWLVNSYTINEYNANNQLIYSAKFKKDSVPNSIQYNSYNSANQRTTYISYSNWNSTTSTWSNVSKQEYIYAADNTTLLGQDNYYAWSNVCDTWKGSSSYRTETNQAGLTTYIATYGWSETYCSWIPQNRRSYIYNASGQTLSETLEINDGANNWIYNSKKEYTYNNSTLIKTDNYEWESASGTWILITGNETTTFTDSHGDSYTKTSKTYTYNVDGTIATYELTTNYYNTEE